VGNILCSRVLYNHVWRRATGVHLFPVLRIFLIKIFLFLLPVALFLAILALIDIFKIFGFEYDYYKDNVVTLNREMICIKTYNHFRASEKFDSFIFGSSRSQAYRCESWSEHLPDDAKPFHFDASGEGIWGISKKIEYIDELGDHIDNALLILDRTALQTTANREGHLFIAMPCISKESKLNYYLAFLKASISGRFLLAYIDYSIFRDYRGYMGLSIRRSEYPHEADNVNCDIWYGYDKQIRADSIGYYNKLIRQGAFYDRPKKRRRECRVTDPEVEQLKKIKEIFTRHNTRYKIIISPIYDQIPLEQEQLNLLYEVFGKENVYDFSGKNRFTEPISNYYETVHFKPYVAHEILNIVYQSNKDQ